MLTMFTINGRSYHNRLLRKLFISIVFFSVITDTSAQSPLVSLQNGQLVYNKYANAGQTNVVNQIPDFSNAGYRGGGIALPVVPVKETVEAVDGDCRALIQAAIDRVAALTPDANGHRGAVLLKAGVYPVEGSLIINTSGVVLRGEGHVLSGTVLIATQQTQHNFIQVRGSGSGYGEVSGSRVRITSAYVPVGTKTIEVAAGHTFSVGDNVIIRKTPNDAWIDTLDMRQFGWTTSSYRITFERKVTAVQGNTLTLDIPLVDPIEQVYGGAEIYKPNVSGRIQECGVENMRIESYFVNNDDESHGWDAVWMSRVENCWARDLVIKYFGHTGVYLLNQAKNCTVQDCAMIDPKSISTGGRKYSFNLDGYATGNLFQRCITWGGRHDFVSGARVTGPNVFLDCVAENTLSDIGPHHRYATGILFDNIYGGQIRVQNREASGTGHGWAGAQTMFWNLYSYKSDIEVESPPAARNWGIGCIGQRQTNTGYWESWGTHVLPRSLYLQQLEERLGLQAVQNIAIPEQLQHTLWDSLRTRIQQIVSEPRAPYGPDSLSSFDITDNGGTITAQYPNTSKPSENFPSLIDNVIQTKYYRSGRTNLWVQYQSSSAAIVTRYTITSANDVPDRDPRNWSLSGSNDGATWTVLDTRSGETFASRFLTKTYTIDSNTTPWIYYRLHITANNGHSGTQFAEWELFERRSQVIAFSDIPDQTYGDDPFDIIVSSSAGLPVTVELVSGPGILNDSTVTITGAGTIIIRAVQEGNEKYFPAVAEKALTVHKAPQTLYFDAISPKLIFETVQLSASTSSGLPVGFTIVSGPATLTGNILKLTGEGLVTIQASQAGNENYEAAAPVQQTILVLGLQSVTDEFHLKIYPNPTRGPVKVKFTDKPGSTVTFTIFNRQGNIIATRSVPVTGHVSEVNFDLSNVANGIYLLHVTNGNKKTVRIIIKY